MLAELKRTLENHEHWRRQQCLNLIASENVTRGMRDNDMNQVAEIIAKVIHGQETPRAARRKAIVLARKFRRVHYA